MNSSSCLFYRPRMPMHSGVGPTGMMGTSQQSYLPFGGNRPSFPQPHNASQDQFDNNLFNKSMDDMPGLPMNRPPGSTPSNPLHNSQPSDNNRFSSPRMAGGDGMRMPFGPGPGFNPMFRHPHHPSAGFPPPPNFSTPPPEHSVHGNQSGNPGHAIGQRSMGGLNLSSFAGSGYMGNNFSQAPGMERPQGGRDQQPQTPPQMNYQQVCIIHFIHKIVVIL